MRDSYASIWNKVLLRCPSASSLLCRDWVKNAFRQVAERRFWSWLMRYGQFITPALYNTGTVTVTRSSSTVTGAGTAFDASMVGRQFRVGTAVPIYTIVSVPDASTLTLDSVYGGATQVGVTYEIYVAYVTPPDDFFAFISVWDPNFNWRLHLNVHQDELNLCDAQRANSGNAYLLSPRDYSTTYSGTIDAALQVRGTGPGPTSTTSLSGYSGPVDGTFTVEVTGGGVSGAATFQWKKDSGAYTVGVVTDPAPQDLADGVQVFWPGGGLVYVAGDTFVIHCTAIPQGGLPRYEVWPHQKAAYVYPFLYVSRATDLDDPGAILPRYIRGDVLLEMALAEASRWPGPSPDKPNPMFNVGLAGMHDTRAERMIMEMERQDDEVNEQDAKYQALATMPFAPLPFLGDASWLQRHSL